VKSTGGEQTITVNADLEITIKPAKFEPNINLDHLDVSGISKGRTKIEAGEFIGSCCSTKVYGIVEEGIVRKLEFSKCEASKRPPKFLKAPVAKAMEAIKPASGGSFEPMPVKKFISHARRGFIDIGGGGGCIYICIFDFCYFCCVVDGDTLCGEAIVVKG